MTLAALTLASAVKEEAGRLGFDAVAIGPATPPPHGAAFARWLDEGRAGSMEYLARTRKERLDPALLLPGVRAVVAVALSYHAREDAAAPAGGLRVARYAGQADYHDVIRPRLEGLARFVDSAAGPGVRSRAAIDTSAVLERDLAARAGLGWFGKNTNLLTPALGSWFFIGIVLTTAEPAFDDEIPDRCGTCTACLDACPTAAFTAPYALDARRCISYLTIEHRGDIDESLRPLIGDWAFGCDVCQDVCPWNRKAATTREPAFASAKPPAAEALLALDDTAFRERFRRTALWRARRSGMLRNAAIVAGNRGDAGAVPALRAALADGDPVIRDAAAWSLSRLSAGSPRPAGQGVKASLVRPLPSLAVVGSESTARRGSLTMDQNKRDQEQHQRDQRRIGNERNRDMDTERNEEETGKPVQLDEEGKEHQGEGKEHQGGQPRTPGPEHKPDQGQHAGQRMP